MNHGRSPASRSFLQIRKTIFPISSPSFHAVLNTQIMKRIISIQTHHGIPSNISTAPFLNPFCAYASRVDYHGRYTHHAKRESSRGFLIAGISKPDIFRRNRDRPLIDPGIPYTDIQKGSSASSIIVPKSALFWPSCWPSCFGERNSTSFAITSSEA